MSLPSSSHAYGIGLIAVIIGAALGVSYYQLYYIPEFNAKPIIPDKVLHPSDTTTIIIIPGSENPSQTQNFTPKTITTQLGVNNLVIWKNTSEAAHTVTPDKPFKDGYNGAFGSPGVIKPGATYQFVFTQEAVIPYHCEPHPWMTGTITIVHGATTS
ncbi:cupredoxin domain-containing protein [Candidatus Nitrosotalea bavarica]|uniref:cupredoxin domain-containing protein n=1 Tax=Candidatus Nitrosotalea bavarica TaxID=1903277 RepID=UPI000C704FCB|nr:plastocyanin/azurin family copper-binding protein [Candidatus Nitrosotalea bavarica]